VTLEQNKQVVMALWESLNNGDFEAMASLYHPDVVYHGNGGEERHGRDAAVEFARSYKNAFPDMTATIEQLVAEGDLVVSRVRPGGTHSGDLMGIPPTGRRIEVRWVMNMMRILEGQVCEEWEIFDEADFVKQLGLD
jgi:steroid delta-isomerase-like uncharacterized protein